MNNKINDHIYYSFWCKGKPKRQEIKIDFINAKVKDLADSVLLDIIICTNCKAKRIFVVFDYLCKDLQDALIVYSYMKERKQVPTTGELKKFAEEKLSSEESRDALNDFLVHQKPLF